MHSMLILYAVLALVTLIECHHGPLVTTAQGQLEGKHIHCKTTRSRYIGFLGIPYAKPPTGRLRFQPPEPPVNWKGIRKAKKEGNRCIQLVEQPSSRACSQMLSATLAFPEYFPKLSKRGKEGSVCTQKRQAGCENCLFLNVYTNKLPKYPGKDLKAVMVWIHGGAFDIGSGNSDIYGPELLLKHDVVVVTFNFRLAAFGFLNLGTNAVSGNMGMKDQVMALRWVQLNINKFGGDPNKVTIFGGGAGGISVGAHMLSPMSKELFHGAISQSGSMLNLYDAANSVETTSRNLVKSLGCENSTNQLHCMQSKSSCDIVRDSLVVNKEWAENCTYYLSFGPTVEKAGVPSPFLQESPITILQNGKMNMVPYMDGVNSDEAIIIKPLMDLDKSYFKERSNLQTTYIPRNLNVPLDNRVAVVDKIKKFYFGKKDLSSKTVDNYFKMVSDIIWINDNHCVLMLMDNVTNSKLYQYQFSFDGEWNFAKKHVRGKRFKGAAHNDELGYLFKMKKRQNFRKHKKEALMSSRMTKMWTNFAKTGNPTSELSRDLQTNWPSYTGAFPSYLDINSDMVVASKLDYKSTQMWEELYRTYY